MSLRASRNRRLFCSVVSPGSSEREGRPGIFGMAEDQRHISDQGRRAGINRLRKKSRAAGQCFGSPQDRVRLLPLAPERVDMGKPEGTHQEPALLLAELPN